MTPTKPLTMPRLALSLALGLVLSTSTPAQLGQDAPPRAQVGGTRSGLVDLALALDRVFPDALGPAACDDFERLEERLRAHLLERSTHDNAADLLRDDRFDFRVPDHQMLLEVALRLDWFDPIELTRKVQSRPDWRGIRRALGDRLQRSLENRVQDLARLCPEKAAYLTWNHQHWVHTLYTY